MMDSLVPDWRLEKMIFYCEKYNGTGYHSKGLPSPYCWAGTTIQEPGKYVADGKFDPNAWDQQPGCCGILYAIHGSIRRRSTSARRRSSRGYNGSGKVAAFAVVMMLAVGA
jgi:hypothetical protein